MSLPIIDLRYLMDELRDRVGITTEEIVSMQNFTIEIDMELQNYNMHTGQWKEDK